MLPLIAADLLRALGLVLIPAAWAVAGWPSAAVMLLVFGAQWLTRWLVPGSALDWGAQAVLLAAGWFSVTGLYHRVEALDLEVLPVEGVLRLAVLDAFLLGVGLRGLRRGGERLDLGGDLLLQRDVLVDVLRRWYGAGHGRCSARHFQSDTLFTGGGEAGGRSE